MSGVGSAQLHDADTWQSAISAGVSSFSCTVPNLSSVHQPHPQKTTNNVLVPHLALLSPSESYPGRNSVLPVLYLHFHILVEDQTQHGSSQTKWLRLVLEMCERPSQLPRTQPVHITAKRHKLGSQGVREAQIASRLAFFCGHLFRAS